MTDTIDPNFTPSGLSRFQGYHLQVFGSGRAKLSLQGLGKSKVDYYAERIKRDREAYLRQRHRAAKAVPDHFARVDGLLEELEAAKVFRVHLQGDNNKTADNAHILASRSVSSIWVVFEGVVHEWQVPSAILHALLAGTGPRVGQASLFNEYLPSYEHDWQEAAFGAEHYRRVLRWVDGEEELALHSVPTTLREPLCPSRAPVPSRGDEYTPDGCLLDDLDGEEPDPEDWALAEAEEPFERIFVEEDEDDAPIGFSVRTLGAGSVTQAFSKATLWEALQG
jgi:hypothetical protein